MHQPNAPVLVEVHEVLADAFANEGVEVVFGLMGDGNKLWLVDMAARPGIRLVHARHEGAALAMADGYARTTGKVGVCAVTYGPGITQLATSLMVAAKHGTPLVVFAAGIDASLRDSGGQLDFNDRALLEAAGAKVREVRNPSQAAEDVHLAFHTARTECRPVALLVGVDLQEQPVPKRLSSPPGPITLPPYVATMPDPSAVDAALVHLAASRRPVILVGRGAVTSGARAGVEALAENLDAAVATTFQAKGWLDDHPRSLGIAGGFALDSSRALFEQADCIVAVGASLNDHTTDHGRLFPNAKLIQIDILPHALVRQRFGADVYLRCDAAAGLSALSNALQNHNSSGHSTNTRISRKPWRLVLENLEDPRHAQLASHPVPIEPGEVDPRQLMLALDRVLPPDAIVVVGGGHCMAFPAQYLTNPGQRSFEMVFDFMTTGQAVPSAIGAAVAHPDRLVLAIEGDASFLMHVQELETASRTGIPLLVMVLNDGALGAEYHKLRAGGYDPTEALAPVPDLARLAEAFGGAGFQLTNERQVADVMTWYSPTKGPHVVDCKVSRAVVGPL